MILVAVGFELGEGELPILVHTAQDGIVPASTMSGLDALLQPPDLGALQEHVMCDERDGRGSLAPHQLFIGAKIFRLAPSSIVENGPALICCKGMRTNEYGIGIDNKIIALLAQLVAAQLQQLLVQPAGPVPGFRLIVYAALRNRQYGPLINERAALAAAQLLHPLGVRRDDQNFANRVFNHRSDAVDHVGERPQVLLYCWNHNIYCRKRHSLQLQWIVFLYTGYVAA